MDILGRQMDLEGKFGVCTRFSTGLSHFWSHNWYLFTVWTHIRKFLNGSKGGSKLLACGQLCVLPWWSAGLVKKERAPGVGNIFIPTHQVPRKQQETMMLPLQGRGLLLSRLDDLGCKY